MHPIFRAYKRYIDLDRLISVSDAYFIDRMGSGGWYVGFDMVFIEADQKISYSRPLTHEEHEFDDKFLLKMVDGTLVSQNDTFSINDSSQILAVHNLQKEIEETIIKPWIQYKDFLKSK